MRNMPRNMTSRTVLVSMTMPPATLSRPWRCIAAVKRRVRTDRRSSIHCGLRRFRDRIEEEPSRGDWICRLNFIPRAATPTASDRPPIKTAPRDSEAPPPLFSFYIYIISIRSRSRRCEC